MSSMYSINSPKNVDEYESQNRCEPCCQTFTDNKPCTETETLGILREFQNLYEDKLKQIDDQPAKNKAQMKIRLLREWVRDLEEQNTMLVQVVEELEQEASERVILLEEKLHLSSKAAYQAMASIEVQPPIDTETDQLKDRITYLESDVKGLMEVIKRIQHQNNWNTDGILFYTISCNDIFGSEHIELPCSSPCKELEIVKDELKITENKLSVKSEEYQILCDKYNKLEKSSKDMRDALTAEVADKHDNIRALRYEYQLLEEQCRQLDKQAQFKDDIIKEMRKELRGVRSKQQLSKLEEIQKVHELSQQHVNEAWEKCKSTKYNQNLSMKDLNEYNLIVEQEHNILYELKKEIDHLVKDMHQKEQQVLEQNEIIDFLNKKIIEAQGILTDIHLKSKKYKKDAENAAYNHEICEQKILKLQESLNNIGLEKNIQNENLLVMQNYHESSTQEQILLGNVKKQINIMIDNLKNRESNIHVLENLMETLEITLINIQDELTSITQKVEKYFVENNDIKTENQQYRFEELHSQLRIHDHKKDIWNKCCSGDDHLQNDQQYKCREAKEKECGDALKEPGKQNQQIQDLQITIAHLQNELIKSQQELIEVRNSFMGDRQVLANENNQIEIDFERTNKEIENVSTIVKHKQQTHIEINSEKDQQILKLAKIVKQYANEIDLYKEQIENLQSEQLVLMNLNVPTQKIVNDFEEYRIKLSESQATIECLKNELNFYSKNISTREDKLFFMENKLKTVNNWFQKLQNKLLKLNTEIEPIDTKQLFSLLLSNAQTGLEKISKEVAIYQQEVLKVDKEVKKNESKVEIEQKKLNEEQNVMLQILKEINVKDVESATYQFKVQSLQKALHLAQMKNMELKMESKKGINNCDQEIMFQLQEYKKEISDLNEKNNILENTVLQMELTIKDMQKKMSACMNEKNCSETRLQENIISLKQLKLKLENADEESKQLIETNLFLKKENQLLRDKIKELQNSFQKMTYETEKNINESFDNSDNKLCANKFPNEQEFKKCKMRLNELENSVISKDAIIENLQQAVNLHQNTILELEKQTLETCKAVNEQDNYIHTLQCDLDCTYELYNGSCSEILDLLKIIMRLQNNNINIETKNLQLEHCLSALEEQLHILQNNTAISLETFENTLHRNEIINEQLNNQNEYKIKQLQEDIKMNQNVIGELQQYKSCSKELIDYFQLSINTLEASTAEATKEMYKKNLLIKELHICNGKLKKVKEYYEIVLTETMNELLKIQEDMKHLQYVMEQDQAENQLKEKNNKLATSCKILCNNYNDLFKKIFLTEVKAIQEAELNLLYCFIIDELQRDLQDKEKELNNFKEIASNSEIKYIEIKDKLKTAYTNVQHVKKQLNQNKENFLKEINNYKTEIANKNSELVKMKRYVDETNKQLLFSISKISLIGEEVKKYLYNLEVLKSENKQLKVHINGLEENYKSLEMFKQLLSEELQNCLYEIYILQYSKNQLENKNSIITNKLNSLQSAFHFQIKDNESKTELTKNLEIELNELTSSRNELCVESKNVIKNIRSWMLEQQVIFKSLTSKIDDLNVLLNNLIQDRQNLISLNIYLREHIKNIKLNNSIQSNSIMNEEIQEMLSVAAQLYQNDNICDDYYSTPIVPLFLDNVPVHDCDI